MPSPKPKRHAFGELKKGYKAMRSKIRTPRASAGNVLEERHDGKKVKPRQTMSTSALPQSHENSNSTLDSSFTTITPSPRRHVRQESLDKQIRFGDTTEDVDSRLQALLDIRDRNQLKLENYEEKSDNLHTSRQDVLDAGSSWTNTDQKRFEEKARKYDKKMEKYRKELEDIDNRITAQNLGNINSSDGGGKKQRFSIDRGSLKQMAHGITATGAGIRRRMFASDGARTPDTDIAEEPESVQSESPPSTQPIPSQNPRRSEPTDASTKQADSSRTGAALLSDTGSKSDLPKKSNSSKESPEVTTLAASGDDNASTPPPDTSGTIVSRKSHFGGGSNDSSVSALDTTTIPASKKSRFGNVRNVFRSKDKSATPTVITENTQIGESEAFGSILAALKEANAKCVESHSVSQRSTEIREVQGKRLRTLEERIAERDEEISQLRAKIAEYDSTIESLVEKYGEQLQEDVTYVGTQITEARRKIAKLLAELKKKNDDIEAAETDIKLKFAEQEGLLSQISQSGLGEFLLHTCGPTVTPSMIQSGLLIIATLLLVSFLT